MDRPGCLGMVRQYGNSGDRELGLQQEPGCTQMARSLFFIAAHFNFVLRAKHIRGKENVLADALSRNNLSLFFHNFPQANHLLTRIPQPV